MTDEIRPIHVRTIRVSATRVGDDLLEVTGQLIDDRPDGAGDWFGEGTDPRVHDMTLTIRVRHPGLLITEVGGGMTTHPYTLCPDTLPSLQQLVGLSVAQGFTRAVNERFGRQNGCAHLTALVQAMAPVVRQGAGAAFGEERMDASRDLWFVNSCHAWRENGPLHERLRAGDVEGLRALSARRRSP
jgi:hypothetical protein